MVSLPAGWPQKMQTLAVLTMSEAYACPNCKAVIFRWHK